MSLIPSSIRRSPSLAALSDLAQSEMASLRGLLAVLLIMDIDQVPAAVLPFLAWQFRADVWTPEASEAVRREQVRSALHVWRYRGTRYAVATALANLGVVAEIVEWFARVPQGRPHTFEVRLAPGAPLSAQRETEIRVTVGRTKPVRSQFDIVAPVDGSAVCQGTCRIGARISTRTLVRARLVAA